jgi:hypothetical protein
MKMEEMSISQRYKIPHSAGGGSFVHYLRNLVHWQMAPVFGLIKRNHLGTADAVSRRRPPHHRNSVELEGEFNALSL